MPRISLSSMWGRIADRGRALFNLPESRSPADLAIKLCDKLVSTQGEASGTALAREVVDLYGKLDATARLAFLEYLATHYGPEPDAIHAAADAYRASGSFADYVALTRSVEPPRRELLGRMNMAPGGTAALVRMRQHVLAALKERPQLEPLETDLAVLLAVWFNRGFLQIERIDWHTPAAILEKLIAYEAVHEIKGWDDLRRRLADDRRCYAFFHPALPDEPLIFVEIALVRGLATAIGPLIAEAPAVAGPQAADTAIFYSISNCQTGLRGISFGNFLIKQVVSELVRDFPSLRSFATLSPIPGFRGWLNGLVRAGTPGLLTSAERDRLKAATGRPASKGAFLKLVESAAWHDEPGLREAVRVPLMRLCALYLTGTLGGRGVTDPVARFHLGNGARIERLNWQADPSRKGNRQAFGIMVNYLYDPALIEENHEAFVREGKAAMSGTVRALVEPSALPRGLRLVGA
jgi:malonyl-CoA decarboxylase